jgi:hypothetical protein
LCVYNPIVVKVGSQRYLRTDTGYCDELVKLIGQRLIDERIETGIAARLTFDGGSVVNILLDPDSASGPEAFELFDGKGRIIVEQNA